MQPGSRIFTLLLLGFVSASAQAAHTRAELLLPAEQVRPGTTLVVGLRLQMNPGWHTYWKNPGDSGMPTTVAWHLPAGISAGPAQWPAPEKLADTNLTTYIYSGETVVFFPLSFDTHLNAGPLVLKANVSWLECKEACIPGQQEVEATVKIGPEEIPSKAAAMLEAAQKKLPQPATAVSPLAWWAGLPSGNRRALELSWASSATQQSVDFFPESSEQFEIAAATEAIPGGAGRVALRKQVTKLAGDWPKQISGLLVEGTGPEKRCYGATLPVAESAPSATGAAKSASPSGMVPGMNAPPLWQMLCYAFLGGLILNVMPCVLPVIALKILGFVNQAKQDARAVRRLGLVYTAGVLASFLALAAVVLAIKAAGRSVGWGFQFGNPYFLLFMTVLVTLVALNLFGLFEITPGAQALTAASALSSKRGASGAFFNGLLATLLATSCSAPFLGAAIGFAFAQPASVVVLIMLTVGAGLAAPYIVLSWHPAWLSLLPKPGRWMERFKIAMGFPMLGAAVWLCSLLTIHYGERAWWMAVFLVFLAVAAWIYGEFVQRGARRRAMAAVVALAVLVSGFAYAVQNQLRWREPLGETSGRESPKGAPQGLEWKPWSTQAVTQARAEHRPVLVDFTAKWCPTCNTIVKPTLESGAVQAKLKEINAVALLADYTLQPPAITAELRRFGRAGVPLVLVYPRNPDAAPIVFDLVTPSALLDALSRAAQ